MLTAPFSQSAFQNAKGAIEPDGSPTDPWKAEASKIFNVPYANVTTSLIKRTRWLAEYSADIFTTPRGAGKSYFYQMYQKETQYGTQPEDEAGSWTKRDKPFWNAHPFAKDAARAEAWACSSSSLGGSFAQFADAFAKVHKAASGATNAFDELKKELGKSEKAFRAYSESAGTDADEILAKKAKSQAGVKTKRKTKFDQLRDRGY